jgi:hypothetical protein
MLDMYMQGLLWAELPWLMICFQLCNSFTFILWRWFQKNVGRAKQVQRTVCWWRAMNNNDLPATRKVTTRLAPCLNIDGVKSRKVDSSYRDRQFINTMPAELFDKWQLRCYLRKLSCELTVDCRLLLACDNRDWITIDWLLDPRTKKPVTDLFGWFVLKPLTVLVRIKRTIYWQYI